jgi:hypothetical protein
MWKKIVMKWLVIGRKNKSRINFLVTCADNSPNILFPRLSLYPQKQIVYYPSNTNFSFGNSYMCHLLTANMGPYSKIWYNAIYTCIYIYIYIYLHHMVSLCAILEMCFSY